MKIVPRKALIAAGGILALTALTYLFSWVVVGDQRFALRAAAAALCLMVAFATMFYVIGELGL